MSEAWNRSVMNEAHQQYRGENIKDNEVAHQYWAPIIEKVGVKGAVSQLKGDALSKLHGEKMSTTAGQMDEITSQDSPLMQRAATQGKQYANKRGLLNSSMGAQATQGAMIDRAMPIAQQDAGFHQDLSKMDRGHGQDMEKLYGTSQANAWGVMANNVTDIVAQSMDSINQIQANPDISAANKQKMIGQVTNMRDTDIKFQQNLYSNLSSYLKNTGVFPSL